MQLDRFPGWAGPIIGPIAGAALSFYGFAKRGHADEVSWPMVGCFAAAGFVGGLLVWLLDWQSQGHKRAVDDLLSRLPPERPGESHEAGGPMSKGPGSSSRSNDPLN
jgi:MFS family permease